MWEFKSLSGHQVISQEEKSDTRRTTKKIELIALNPYIGSLGKTMKSEADFEHYSESWQCHGERRAEKSARSSRCTETPPLIWCCPLDNPLLRLTRIKRKRQIFFLWKRISTQKRIRYRLSVRAETASRPSVPSRERNSKLKPVWNAIPSIPGKNGSSKLPALINSTLAKRKQKNSRNSFLLSKKPPDSGGFFERIFRTISLRKPKRIGTGYSSLREEELQ